MAAATPYTSSGRIVNSTPPSTGPPMTAAWPAIERSAIALASSSEATTSVGSARPDGAPSDPAAPVATASARNGHSWVAPSRLTTTSARSTPVSMTSEKAKTKRRGKWSAIWPAGSASTSSGRNSARPIRPRSNGSWSIE